MASPVIAQLLDSRVGDLFLSALERVEEHPPNSLRVLTWHRVLDPAAFARQIDWLVEQYRPVSLGDVEAAWQDGTRLPPRAVLVTFDDAYRDFALHAWPVLRRRGVPVVLFVPTAFPDHPERVFWWDRLEHAISRCARRVPWVTECGRFRMRTSAQRAATYRALRDRAKTLHPAQVSVWVDELVAGLHAPPLASQVLGWDELRELARDGVTLGAHSRTHPDLSQLTREEVEAEVAGSLDDLRHRIGEVASVFAYPDGRTSPEVAAVVRACGISLAFSTVPGTNVLPHASRWTLRRINVGPAATVAVLRAQLLRSSVRLHSLHPLPA